MELLDTFQVPIG